MFFILPNCHVFVTYFLVEVCECADAFLSAAFRNYAHMRALEVQTHLGYHFKINGGETEKNTETRNKLHKNINMLQSRQLPQTRQTGNKLGPQF